MNPFEASSLRALALPREGPTATLYIPTSQVGEQFLQNRVRVRQAIEEAASRLEQAGVPPSLQRQMLGPARALLEEARFWEAPPRAAAFFLAPQEQRAMKLDIEVPQRVHLDPHRFHLRPLAPLVSGPQRFFLLALSQSRTRFFEGTRGALRELAGLLPPSLDVALAPQGVESLREAGVHTGFPPGRPALGGPHLVGGAFHARDPRALQKERLVEFFRALDEALRAHLRAEQAPLILAGVEALHPLYRAVNRYPHLLPEGLRGNLDRARAEEILPPARALLDRALTRARQDALARLQEWVGTDRATHQLEQVVLAACQGRIETLFIPGQGERWGVCSPEEGTVRASVPGAPQATELINLATLETWRTGGRVLVSEPGELPDGRPMAALLRYA